jgi:LDH2 family malate/lactate/ureidoglycolate dehydrogenase
MSNDMLDQDRPDSVRMTEADAHVLSVRALQRLGFAADEARITADQMVDNALCGYGFAGPPRILSVAEDKKTFAGRTPPHVVRETPSTALIDGGNTIGYVAAYRGAELAIEKARSCGIAMTGVYNSWYSGRNAYYVEQIVKAGLVAIHSCSASPHVVPPGGRAPVLGTNPFCVGFPSANGPVIYDIGTASVMWGEVMLMARLGHELPEGVGFDADGNPTRDAAQAAKGGVTPWGGHKGYGLSFAIQALGLLAGAALGHGQVCDYGFLFIAIDPGTTLPGGGFQAQMAELVQHIKATPRQDGVDEIRIPSERAFRERERRRVEGILLDRKVVDALNAV